MPLIEGCKHQLDITIPRDALAEESDRVAIKVQKKANIKGFRPGKTPLSIIKSQFSGDIRKDALEALIPKFIQRECEKEHLRVVSRPEVKDLHFHEGEDVHFKAIFEVAPEFELKDVRGLKVAYAQPVVSDSDVETRLKEILEGKGEYINVDPRPAQDGDHCLVDLASISGLEGEPMRQTDINIEIGGESTFQPFTDALRGAIPGDEREATIEYPADYHVERFAGRAVRFAITLKQIRLRELPELNDEFAKDVGDYQSLDELRDAIRKNTSFEREYVAQTLAKNALIDKLVEMHDFPVPEAYIDSQIEAHAESQLQSMKAQGIDISKIRLDWEKLREAQYDKAKHDVKASLLLGKIASSESIFATQEDVDAEVRRIAGQRREPVAAVRMTLEKDGTLGRIANRITTDKTLNFLFEHAIKEAPAASE